MADQPLMTPRGRRRATFAASPAVCTTSHHGIDILVRIGLFLGEPAPTACPGNHAAAGQFLIDAAALQRA